MLDRSMQIASIQMYSQSVRVRSYLSEAGKFVVTCTVTPFEEDTRGDLGISPGIGESSERWSTIKADDAKAAF
jgi:hypothetical protein